MSVEDDILALMPSPAAVAHERLDALMTANPHAAEAICIMLAVAQLPATAMTLIRIDEATGLLRAALVDGGQRA